MVVDAFLAGLVGAILLAQSPVQTGRSVRIVLVGDSTVNDEGGWGTGFRASFGPQVEVINLAKNGRSSKSFRDEGLWEPALTAGARYLVIQFGHNDGPGKGPERETDAATTYRANLIRYIHEARAAGAEPVLATSIVRRVFDGEGRVKRDSLVPYVEAARAVAAEQNVPLLDLYSLTLTQAEQLGPEGCADIDARTPDGKRDTTHLGAKGRSEIGRLAARELLKVRPELREFSTLE